MSLFTIGDYELLRRIQFKEFCFVFGFYWKLSVACIAAVDRRTTCICRTKPYLSSWTLHKKAVDVHIKLHSARMWITIASLASSWNSFSDRNFWIPNFWNGLMWFCKFQTLTPIYTPNNDKLRLSLLGHFRNAQDNWIGCDCMSELGC